MKNLFTAIVMLLSVTAMAQPIKVSLQASGLTCSMCSNAINKSLQSLDFVDRVISNIKTSTFEVSFKLGAPVDFDKMKTKVEDAGFSVAKFAIVYHFDKQTASNDSHVVIGDRTFHFVNVKDQVLDGDQTVRVLDKGFVTAKEYKKNSAFTKMECYKTGTAADCCKKDRLATGTRIYHVTI